MLFHIGAISKCCSTCGTSVGLFTCVQSSVAFQDPGTAEAFTTICTSEWTRVCPNMGFKKWRTVKGFPTNCAIVAVPGVVLGKRLHHCCRETILTAFLDVAGFFNRAWIVFNWDEKGIEKCLFNYKVKKRKIYIAEKWGFYRENNVLLYKVVAFQAGTNC